MAGRARINPFKENHLGGGDGRNLRYDEDWKASLDTSLASGDGSMENICQADPELGKDRRRCARKIVESSLTLYMATEWERFSEPLDGPCAISADAARHGNPAEDIENYAFWCGQKQSGCWLPSMVGYN